MTKSIVMVLKILGLLSLGAIFVAGPCGSPLLGDRVYSVRPQYIPIWEADGSEIFFSGLGGSFLVSTDGNTLTRMSTPTTRTTRDSYGERQEPAYFELSHRLSPHNNRAVFITNKGGVFFDLATSSRDGTEVKYLWESNRPNAHPVWSPDGSRIAYLEKGEGERWDVFTVNVDGKERARLTVPRTVALPLAPAWSPDGKRVAFSGKTPADGKHWLFIANQQGTELFQYALPKGRMLRSLPAWFLDGKRIAFVTSKNPPTEVKALELQALKVETRETRKLKALPTRKFIRRR